MFISSEEMTRRPAEADRRRLALRKASQELSAFGKQLLKQRSKAPAMGSRLEVNMIEDELNLLAAELTDHDLNDRWRRVRLGES